MPEAAIETDDVGQPGADSSEGAGDVVEAKTGGAPTGADLRKASGNGLMSADVEPGADGADGEDAKPAEGATPRPAAIPAKFWDAEAGEARVDDLAGAYSKLEAAHAKLKSDTKQIAGEVPADVAEYLTGEDADKFLTDVKETASNVVLQNDFEDPGLQVWAKVAHELNIPKSTMLAAAQMFMTEMNDFVPAPVDPETERERLGKTANAQIAEIQNWSDGLYNRGIVSEGELQTLLGLAGTADGVRLVQKIRKDMGHQVVLPAEHLDGEFMSNDEWGAAFRAAVAAKDYTEQARLEQLGEELFGNMPAGAPTVNINP